MNRTVAGVHFPVDSAAGCFLGLALGQYFWRRCTVAGPGTYDWFVFTGSTFPWGLPPPLDGDFYWEEIYRKMFGIGGAPYVTRGATPQPVQPNAILRWLWGKARAEWQ